MYLDLNSLLRTNSRSKETKQEPYSKATTTTLLLFFSISMKMKEDLIRSIGKNNNHHSKADSSAHVVGSKVLPICDSTSSSSSSSLSSLSSSKADDQQQCGPTGLKKNASVIRGETNSKSKTLSRMKELLRWAAAAKSDRGKLGKKVLHFRNKSATVKTGGLDGDNNNDSPKISLKWEVESCDTSCSAASAPPSIRYDESSHRTGNWITTDDEFVVLEL